MTSVLLLIVLCRAGCGIALVADDAASRTRQSPAEGDHRNGDAADEFVDRDNSGETEQPRGRRPADPRQVRWATAAHDYVLGVDCQRSAFSTPRECLEVQRIDRSRWNVYLADPLPPSGAGRRCYLRVVLPDGPVGDAGRHHHRVDGVVALDPYPDANFGHLVVVFHVTIAASSSWCQRRDGVLIGKH